MAAEPRLDAWLSVLVAAGGSSLLLTDGARPLIRRDGGLVPIEGADPLTGEEIEVISRTQIRDQYGDRLHLGHDVDFSFVWRDRARIRASAFYQRSTCSLSLRVVPDTIPTGEEAGLPAGLDPLFDRRAGLLLVSSPSPDVRSALLASMVDRINRTRPWHIATVEDPIEYVHHNRVGAVSQREIGTDSDTFAAAVRAVARAEADVVMLSDLRDAETALCALSVAENGRLVLAGLPAADAAVAVNRLVGAIPASQRDQARVQLATCLLGVVHRSTEWGGAPACTEFLAGRPEVAEMLLQERFAELHRFVAQSPEADRAVFRDRFEDRLDLADGTVPSRTDQALPRLGSLA